MLHKEQLSVADKRKLKLQQEALKDSAKMPKITTWIAKESDRQLSGGN